MHEQCDIFIRSESSRTYTHIYTWMLYAPGAFSTNSPARAGGEKKSTPEMRVKHRCREDPARNILLYIRRGRRNKKPEPRAPRSTPLYSILLLLRTTVVSGKFLHSSPRGIHRTSRGARIYMRLSVNKLASAVYTSLSNEDSTGGHVRSVRGSTSVVPTPPAVGLEYYSDRNVGPTSSAVQWYMLPSREPNTRSHAVSL